MTNQNKYSRRFRTGKNERASATAADRPVRGACTQAYAEGLRDGNALNPLRYTIKHSKPLRLKRAEPSGKIEQDADGLFHWNPTTSLEETVHPAIKSLCEQAEKEKDPNFIKEMMAAIKRFHEKMMAALNEEVTSDSYEEIVNSALNRLCENEEKEMDNAEDDILDEEDWEAPFTTPFPNCPPPEL